jgi:hypothetical protein
MFPELSIERVFRRELDSLPLPDEQAWIPSRTTGPSAILVVSVVSAALLLVVAAAGLIREDTGAATQPRGVASTPSLRPRATCEPPAYGANGRCARPVPNGIRNPAFGYNLTIPGEWHEANMPSGTAPFVADRPNASGPSLSAPFLLDRKVFTARSPYEWVLTTDNAVPAWDLDVQVWDRQGRTALEWSRMFGPCDPPVPNYGISHCTQRTEVIRGGTFLVTTVTTFRGPQTTSYYLDRGDQMLILRYSTDPGVAPPSGVTPATLEGIVHSIGLV